MVPYKITYLRRDLDNDTNTLSSILHWTVYGPRVLLVLPCPLTLFNLPLFDLFTTKNHDLDGPSNRFLPLHSTSLYDLLIEPVQELTPDY
jgi:hypothetical protein